MLRLISEDVEGNKHEFKSFVSITLNSDEKIPADDLSVTLPYTDGLPELVYVTLADDENTVFTGIVDEQHTVVTGGKALNKIIARSLAALLLDNESIPVNYFYPSASVIFSRHLKPLGIPGLRGEDVILKDRLNVFKGTTDWQVLSAFCRKALGTFPRVDESGYVNLYGISKTLRLYFSNNDGIRYSCLKEKLKRCNRLSDIWVKLKDSAGYSLDVENTEAKKKGVRRVRYLDASGSTSLNVADTMMRNAEKASCEFILTSPERLTGTLGAGVTIKDSVLGEFDGLYVSSIFYSLSPNGEYTTLTLKKEN